MTGALQEFLRDISDVDPEPEYIIADTETDGDIRRMTAVRQLEDGSIEKARHVFQLTPRGIENLMVALYGDRQVFEAKERYAMLMASKADIEADLMREVRDWRAKFAALAIHFDMPDDATLGYYVALAAGRADASDEASEPFPYGVDPNQWPPPVRAWMYIFTRAILSSIITPPEPWDVARV